MGKDLYFKKNGIIDGYFYPSQGRLDFFIKDSQVYAEYNLGINFLNDTFYQYNKTEDDFDNGQSWN